MRETRRDHAPVSELLSDYDVQQGYRRVSDRGICCVWRQPVTRLHCSDVSIVRGGAWDAPESILISDSF